MCFYAANFPIDIKTTQISELRKFCMNIKTSLIILPPFFAQTLKCCKVQECHKLQNATNCKIPPISKCLKCTILFLLLSNICLCFPTFKVLDFPIFSQSCAGQPVPCHPVPSSRVRSLATSALAFLHTITRLEIPLVR